MFVLAPGCFELSSSDLQVYQFILPLLGMFEKYHIVVSQHLEHCIQHPLHTVYWFHEPEEKPDFEIKIILLDSSCF